MQVTKSYMRLFSKLLSSSEEKEDKNSGKNGDSVSKSRGFKDREYDLLAAVRETSFEVSPYTVHACICIVDHGEVRNGYRDDKNWQWTELQDLRHRGPFGWRIPNSEGLQQSLEELVDTGYLSRKKEKRKTLTGKPNTNTTYRLTEKGEEKLQPVDDRRERIVEASKTVHNMPLTEVSETVYNLFPELDPRVEIE